MAQSPSKGGIFFSFASLSSPSIPGLAEVLFSLVFLVTYKGEPGMAFVMHLAFEVAQASGVPGRSFKADLGV